MLLYKRLERGTLDIPLPGLRHVEIDADELGLMLEGLGPRGARRRTRWYRLPSRSKEPVLPSR